MTHFLATHWVHGSILVIPVVAIVWALGPEVVARRRDGRSRAAVARVTRTRLTLPLSFVAVGTLGAAAVHAAVIREHFGESTLYGTFFLVAAVVQLGYAALVVTVPNWRLLVAGLVGNASVVALWAVTRFVAIPLGRGAGEREEIGRLDLTATGFEVLAVAAAVVALIRFADHASKPSLPRLPSQREPVATPSTSNVRLVTKD